MTEPVWLQEARATIAAEREAARAAEELAEKQRQSRRTVPFPEAVGSCHELVAAGLAHDVTGIARYLAEVGNQIHGFSVPVLISTAAASRVGDAASIRRVLEWAHRACHRRGFPDGAIGAYSREAWERYPMEDLGYRGLPEGLRFVAYPLRSGSIFWVVQTKEEQHVAWRPEWAPRPLRDVYRAG